MTQAPTNSNSPQFWDQRFSAPEFIYGTEPNVSFKDLIDRLEPGKLLLPAEGQGRNAAYAAGLGWQVTAFDSSPVAKERALELAALKQVSYTYLTESFENFDAGQERFDFIAMIFVHMLPETRMLVHRRLLQWLKPGGYILVEAFAKEQIEFQQKYNSGGPPNVQALFSAHDLQSDFNSLNLIELNETVETLTEGSFHSGQASLLRLIGQKN